MSKKTQANFEEATSQNLPMMDYEMITDFFVSNADFFSAEIKNRKASKAARETYADNAIAFVQVKREGEMCHVKAQITPEHKIRSKNYNIDIMINEKEQSIASAVCLDCQASKGGCKHCVAILFWLHRKSEKAAVTEVECYWRPSPLSKVGSSLKFMKIKDVAGKAPPAVSVDSKQFFEEFMTIGTASGSASLIFKQKFGDSATAQCSIHQMFQKFKTIEVDDWRSADKFLEYIENNLSDQICTEVVQETKTQAKSQEWFEARFARITASNLYEMSRCKTLDGSLVEKVMGACKVPETPAIKRGKELEAHVLDTVSKIYNLKLEKVGLFIKKEFGIFGASPDGITSTHCIEVKCPFKEKTVQSYVSDDGEVQKKGLAQLQLQMFLSGRKHGYFCVASPNFLQDKGVQVHEIDLDEEWVLSLMNEAVEFWKIAVFPNLCK